VEPRSLDAIRHLVHKGVDIPNPLSIDIAPDVDLDRISGDGVVIHPGCRVSGARTVLSAGVQLGAEGPVTVSNCQLGPGVALKGGYAEDAVFLEGANLGLGHHVRAGTLLEEESGGAHCVGLKQTILLPFVVLGSLINFCDCLMAGGTSRKDHSEVGSSYIHFNFTPDGDKATPSLFGDVPRGVMLRERPIFLGGQGGTVGPVHVAYGTVVGAGSVLRSDVHTEGTLVVVGPPPSLIQPYSAGEYRAINRLVGRNIDYLANLRALSLWYAAARRPFFDQQDLGPLVYDGAVTLLEGAWDERVARLTAMVARVAPSDAGRELLQSAIGSVCVAAGSVSPLPADRGFLDRLGASAHAGSSYIAAVRAMTDADRAAATTWLTAVVDEVWALTSEQIPQVRRLARPRVSAADPREPR
jgi:UDP-N-acetylglucosamine/UDP-N-acetylgalactosamine diphosphorylase